MSKEENGKDEEIEKDRKLHSLFTDDTSRAMDVYANHIGE